MSKQTLNRAACVALCEALNYHAAAKMSNERLKIRVGKIAEAIDDEVFEELEEATEKTLREVIALEKDGADWDIQDEPGTEKPKAKKKKAPAKAKAKKSEPEEEEEESAPKKKKAPSKAKAKSEKKEKAPAKVVEKDALGNRLGSQAAQVNAVMAKKFQTVDQIAEACDLSTGRVASHMRYLMKRELVECKDKKFRLI